MDTVRVLLQDGRRRSAGSTDVHRLTIDLHATIADVIAELEGLLRLLDVRVVFENGDQLPPVAGDPDALYRLLLHIVVHAVESMTAGGHIVIGAHTGPLEKGTVTVVVIEIAVAGEGLPPEVMSRVFEHGLTGDHPAREHGLELANWAQIIEEHGGAIELSRRHRASPSLRILLPIHGETRARGIKIQSVRA
jgi:two-component system cell cycle sensor histidine kinase/response regulator CckA